VKVDQLAGRGAKLSTNYLMKWLGCNIAPVSEPNVEAAWSAEIERRLVEIDAGTVELIPWDDVRSELFGECEWRE
jgi:putative addiction module component (TIGR02574 family)